MLRDSVYFGVAYLAISIALLLVCGPRMRPEGRAASFTYQTALIAAAMGFVLGVHRDAVILPAAGLAEIFGIALVALAPEWNAAGQAAFSASVVSGGAFLLYSVYVTAVSRLGAFNFVLSSLLTLFVAIVMFLMALHTYELVDTVCRIRWRRVARPRPEPDFRPMVSIHVPVCNEPPDIVEGTLRALARLDYPDYEVIVVDNNTPEESVWRPVEALCKELGFKFEHADTLPGFKAGALNRALRRTDPRAEIVGVIDSDYQLHPAFLKEVIGHFLDPALAFVQAPQDYRGLSPFNRYTTACYLAYRFFFALTMHSSNEHNGIIFCGTMGLLRRSALEELGGWSQWCLTEDSELSLRLLAKGYRSLYIDRSYGQGLMPMNFADMKRQHFRWSFGGMQVLRLHARELLLGWRDPSNRLGWGQRAAYLIWLMNWLVNPVTFGFTAIILVSSFLFNLNQWNMTHPNLSAPLAAGTYPPAAGLSPLLSAHWFSMPHVAVIVPLMRGPVAWVPFIFIFYSVLRYLWALRLKTGCTWSQALSAFEVVLGLSWTITWGCFLGLAKKEGVWHRTPKQRSDSPLVHAVRGTLPECLLAGLCFASIALGLRIGGFTQATLLLASLLAWQGWVYACAPWSAFLGFRSESEQRSALSVLPVDP